MMEGLDVLVMIVSMFASFVLGVIGMLMFGGRTSLNYLMVKMSRGRKVLLFGKTGFGWESYVAKKKESKLEWKLNKSPIKTSITDGSVTRYARVDAVFVDSKTSANTLSLKDGVMYPDDFDPVVFDNILIRAQTRPSVDGNDDLKKMVMIVLILVGLIAFGVLFTYLSVSDLAKSFGGVI